MQLVSKITFRSDLIVDEYVHHYVTCTLIYGNMMDWKQKSTMVYLPVNNLNLGRLFAFLCANQVLTDS